MIKRVFTILFLILFVQASPVTMSGKVGKGIRSNGGHGTSANGGKTFVITDFGATCDGIADDGPAYAAAGVAMRAFQTANPHMPVTLVNPVGTTCHILTCPNPPFSGVENFTWIMTNATQNGSCGKWGTGDWAAAGGGGGTPQFNFNPNNVGDTCVTMTTPGTEVNYTIGNWVVVAGQGIQVNSFPPNYVNWEYAQIAAKPTNQVCFTAPLKHAYPNTPIDLSLANCSNIYCGGPGALVGLVPSWGGYWHIIGGTWNTTAPFTFNSRTLILDNVTIVGDDTFQHCHFPSVVQTITYNNVNINCKQIEVDKEIDAMIVNGGAIGGFTFQSPSINSITLNNTHILGSVGTPLATICNNSTIDDLRMGTSLGTMPESFSGTNCNVTNFSNSAFANLFTPFGSYNGNGAFVFTHRDIYGGLEQWASAGGKMYMSSGNAGNANNEITIGVSNIPGFIPGSTDQTIVFPVTPNFGASLPPSVASPFWAADQARDMSCSGCAGNAQMLDLNFSAAQHQPVYTYANHTYTCAANVGNIPNSHDINGTDGFIMAGAFNTVVINVSTADANPADAGGRTLGVRLAGTFNTATGVAAFDPGGISEVNVVQTGTRTLFMTATTGAQAGDTLFSPGAGTWLAQAGVQIQSAGVTNGPAAQCPVVNLIWQTTR